MTPSESLSHPDLPPRATADDRGDAALRVVVAPNAFKGSLSAVDAAEAMATGIRGVVPEAIVDLAPIADGGDGSVAAFVRAGFTPHAWVTRGPTGDPVTATIAVRGDVAVIELADACGMARLPDGRPAPMESSTLGLGDALLGALDTGARSVIVCLGGSASTDGGAGMLVALGARLLDSSGRDVPPSGESLAHVAALDLTRLDSRLADVRITAAVDVDSPLTGRTGAAAVFAPQKGATAEQVTALEVGLTRWAAVLGSTLGHALGDVPGAGAAGGTGAGLLALGADIRPGFAEVARAIDLPRRVAQADLVVTGEGRLDAQSLLGKGVGGVAAMSAKAGVAVLAVCGEIALAATEIRGAGIVGWQDLRSLADSDDRARSHVHALLVQATALAVGHWRDA